MISDINLDNAYINKHLFVLIKVGVLWPTSGLLLNRFLPFVDGCQRCEFIVVCLEVRRIVIKFREQRV